MTIQTRIKTHLTTTCLAAMIVGSTLSGAIAADIIPDATPVAPPLPNETQVFTWQGGYLGVSAGAGITNFTPGANATGVLGGVFAGYNIQNGNIVFAPEIDIDGTRITNGGVQLDYIARAKAKIGYSFDRALVSAIAGAAYTKTSGGTAPKGLGFLVGTGADYAITDNVFGGGEYLYHQFNNLGGSGTKVQAHTVKARIGFKF